jgi:GT2 family glycosyltransferase
VVSEIIVVDNASRAEERVVLDHLRHLSKVRVLLNDSNLGFARACNQGAGVSSGQVLLFLNPDTIVTERSIAQPAELITATQGKGIGVIGIQMRDEHGHVSRTSARFPELTSVLLQIVGLDRLLPGLVRGHFMREWHHREDRSVDQVMGAFFMTRRTVFEVLGGFDERFFVYFEEVDYCKRVKEIGLDIFFMSTPFILHTGAGTTNSVKDRRLFYFNRARLRYFRKHFGDSSFLTVLIASLLIEPVTRVAYLLSRGRPDEIPAVLRGFSMLYRSLPQLLSRHEPGTTDHA